MPRFPHVGQRPRALGGSVFERFRDQMARHGDGLLKLQIGDTCLPPSYALPVDAGFLANHPDFNRYCNTFGVPALRQALAEKLRLENQLQVGAEHVMLTAGAANALSIACSALLDPGDEVIVCTPAWPFFFGMVRVAGATVVEAPLYMRLYAEPDLRIDQLLDRLVGPRTAALYVNSPNNPSGKVLDRGQLQQVASVALAHGLWLISDEAYDGLAFDGRPTLSPAALPGMFERTLSVFSFSKTWMFAGLRLGYVVAAEEVLTHLNKIMVHQLYGPSTLAQHMMLEPVRTRGSWIPATRARFQQARDRIAPLMPNAAVLPEGGYFFFLPLGPARNGRDPGELLRAWMEAGVAVAPGSDFGAGFDDHVRLCFTGEPLDRLELAVRRWNAVLTGARTDPP